MPSSRKFFPHMALPGNWWPSCFLFLRAEEFQDSISLRPDTPQANRRCTCWVQNYKYTFSAMVDSVTPSQHSCFVSLHKIIKYHIKYHSLLLMYVCILQREKSWPDKLPSTSSHDHWFRVLIFVMRSSKKSKKRKRSSPVEEETFAVGNLRF